MRETIHVHFFNFLILVTTTAATPAVRHDGREHVSLPRDLSVGIPSIDEEHRLILELICRIDAAGEDRSGQVAREVLADLKEYTIRHFKHEESLLRSVDYPELDEHIAEHRALSRRVDQLMAESDQMHHDNLVQLLNGWIRHHIMEVDRRYADYVVGHGEAGASESETAEESPCLT